jgi:heme/copper-type cytochrome/quinol oxidase subunit 4
VHQGPIYLLCAATALACCLLLFRGYRCSRVRLLLWCSLCFLALTVENVILFIDLVVLPDQDLSYYHFLTAAAGAVVLLYGLIWEVK